MIPSTASRQVPAQDASISGSGDYQGAGLDSREVVTEVRGSGTISRA